MALNNLAVDTFTTSVLIGDTVATTGSSQDGIPTLTTVNGNTVSAALEIQSTEGGFLPPRMTLAQMAAIDVPSTGMQVFVTDNNSTYVYTGAAWAPQNVISTSFTLSAAQLKALRGTPVTLLAAPGAGLAYIPKSVVYEYNFLTTAFTIPDVGNFVINQGAVAINTAFAATGFINQTVSKLAFAPIPALGSTSVTSLVNQAITVKNDSATAEWTLGLGNVVITLTYAILAV